MRDRQLFEEKQLANGIRVFRYIDETPYTHVILRVPVGSSNSVGSILPGAFHFLEHMLTLRSMRHSELRMFEHLIGLKGGNFNATTSPFDTTYEIQVPTKHLSTVLSGFYSQIFEPVFDQQDIARQRGIIANERCKKERWFPRSSEIGQYICTQWEWDCLLSLRQRLGYDEDLARMTPESLREAHRYYFDNRIQVISGGSGDIEPLCELLSGLKVSRHQPTQHYDPIRWVNQEYHERGFRDSSRFELRYGGITTPGPSPLVILAFGFILNYLTNSIHGALHEWLREEKGWTYGVHYAHCFDDKSMDWILSFPLGSREQVDVVRKELLERITSALANEEAVNQEVDRIRDHADAFFYLTLKKILEEAQESLENFGYIISETHLQKYLEEMRDTQFLQRVWSEHFTPEQTGCFCAVPLDS